MEQRPNLGPGTVIRTVAVREDQEAYLKTIPNVSRYIRDLIDRDHPPKALAPKRRKSAS